MLKKLLFVLALLPSFVFAQTMVTQGGTGLTSVANNTFLMGSSTLRLQAVASSTVATLLNYWTKSGTNLYYNSGNVGIGTTTPQAPLEVYSPSGNVGNMARFSSGYSSGGFVSLFDVANNTTRGYFGYGPTLFTIAGIGDAGFRSQGGFAIGTNGGTVRQYINSSGAFGLGGSITNVSTFAGASLVGNSSGNIGIGTTSPGTSLTVGAGLVAQIPNGAGSYFTPQISNSQTSGVAGISAGVSDGTNYRRAGLFVNQTNGVWGLSSLYTSGAIPFVINDAGTERLRIDTSGNVGIGTTTPVAPLTVYSTSTSGTSPVFMVATTTPIIRAQANGRVGIGSNVGTPSAPLHIFTPVANSTTVTGQYIVNAGSGAGAGAELLLGYAATAAGTGGIASFYDTSHFGGTVGVKTRLSAGGTTFLTGSVTGDVGIGTTTPSARLAIQGTSGSTTPLFSIASSSGTINPILQVIPVATYGGFVGINAPTPTYQLEISSDANSTGRGLLIGQHSADAGAAVITAQKSRGTRSSPTTVVSGDYTFAFAGQSYDGSAYRNTANFGYRTSGTIASNSIPGQWFFAATSSNDTNPYTNGTVRMVIGSDGNVGIGTTTPNSVLTIASSTTSTSTSILNIFNSLSTPIMRILGSGAVLFGTITTANCGNAPCGLTVGTTTQFTAGTVARVVGYSSAASTTINLNTTDIATTTIDRATTFVNPTGTAYDGQMFEIRAKATTTQTVYWDTAFASSTDLTNVSSVASGTTRFLFEYRQDVGNWELVGKLAGYIN